MPTCSDCPTAGIKTFIQSGTHLDPVPASNFYVAVTRVEQTVAIVIDELGDSQLEYWDPSMAAQQGVEPDVE